MDRRPAAARPSFDLAWLRVLVTIALAALAAALTVLAGPEPAASAEAHCLSLTPAERAIAVTPVARATAAAPSATSVRQPDAASRADGRCLRAAVARL